MVSAITFEHMALPAESKPDSVIPMERTSRIIAKIAIAAALGAGYGMWGLEAASPLAIPLVLWAVLALLLVWRTVPRFGLFIAYIGGFVMGFGLVWTVVLGHLAATCKPPSCQTADGATDVLYAGALLIPLIAVGSALLAVRRLAARR